MQTNIERVAEMIRALPVEDFAELREVLNEVERQKKSENGEKEARLEEEIEQYKKARKWINEHSAEYMNQWVCLEGDRLIAHGADGLEVHRKAKSAGIKAPFLHRIVDESKPFGGW